MKTFLVSSAALILSLARADLDHARGLRGDRPRPPDIGGPGGRPLKGSFPGKGNGPRKDKGKLFNKGKGKFKGMGKGWGRGKGIKGKGWGKAKGRGDNKLDFLQGKVDEKIETLECTTDAVVTSTDCDAVMFKPERLEVVWRNLTREEWAMMVDEKKIRMDDYVGNLAHCVKCEGMLLEDLLPDKEDILEKECDDTCPAPADLDCTFPPKRSEAARLELTEEERATLRDEREGRGGGARDRFRAWLVQCVCCTEDFDLNAALAKRPTDGGPGRGGRPGKFGGKFGGKP